MRRSICRRRRVGFARIWDWVRSREIAGMLVVLAMRDGAPMRLALRSNLRPFWNWTSSPLGLQTMAGGVGIPYLKELFAAIAEVVDDGSSDISWIAPVAAMRGAHADVGAIVGEASLVLRREGPSRGCRVGLYVKWRGSRN
jgi:hypothetical protein